VIYYIINRICGFSLREKSRSFHPGRRALGPTMRRTGGRRHGGRRAWGGGECDMGSGLERSEDGT
jgi:hypothetical protein